MGHWTELELRECNSSKGLWLYCCYSLVSTHFILKRWCEAFELIKLDSLINTSVANFDTDNNTNILNLLIQYQYQFQYLRIWKGIPISISIPQKSKFNNNTNINTQIFQIQYQAQYNTKVSRYFAISRQYQKRSSRYRACHQDLFCGVRRFRKWPIA